MDTERAYCLCGLRYDPNVFMIQCDICKDWFHSSCTNFQEQTAPEIDKYHCPRCSPVYGPSQFKPYRNYHRHDYWDEDALTKPVQTGTATFIKELKARHFHSEDEIVLYAKGSQITETFFTQNEFQMPIVIPYKDGLEMLVPPENFTLYDVENNVGGDHEMDVIDVVRQSDLRMKLNDFVSYYYSADRTKVYNVVSLEFSKTGLSKMVEAPVAARQLDWANIVWPKVYELDQLCVQKYCLMSVKDSYTDFHIDFGGTSVWYHVLRGQKIFYLIKPTAAHMTLYQQWMTSSNQSETFFGDQVDQCFKCVLKAGQTMMIPTGWIHAVLTPEDSLVFGGNFLHSLNIPMQLQVYDIEKKVKTAVKFLYPYFETMHWFAAQKLLAHIHTINSGGGKCPNWLLTGLKTLMTYLKAWNTDKEVFFNTTSTSRDQIPLNVNVAKLFKDISKETRQAERYLNTLNPPKPERESKRKRKRPVNKDFVEFPFGKLGEPIKSENNVPVKISKKPMPVKTGTGLKVMLPKVSAEKKKMAQREMTWPLPIPETATAVHRGGTVLKIKLGTKEPVMQIPVMDTSLNKLVQNHPQQQNTIYDFKDDDSLDLDESLLFIDENPQPQRRAKKQQDWKLKTQEEPANGIESLLKASALATKFIDRNEQGRTSPSTQEAIAGMLSIGQTFVQPKKSNKHRKRLIEQTLLEEEELNDVHQDDDYIYPAIENADEELYQGRGADEAWSPRARVGPLLPKMNRPAREGTKKQAVEKVLEAAAKRSSAGTNKAVKKANRRKKPKTPKPLPLLALDKIETTPTATSIVPGPSHSNPQTPTTPTNAPSPTRSRKGMKTAKQRLGKILKIHKMIH